MVGTFPDGPRKQAKFVRRGSYYVLQELTGAIKINGLRVGSQIASVYEKDIQKIIDDGEFEVTVSDK